MKPKPGKILLSVECTVLPLKFHEKNWNSKEYVLAVIISEANNIFKFPKLLITTLRLCLIVLPFHSLAMCHGNLCTL